MLKRRQRLGKYLVVRRLADGGFATVYRASDTIEGTPVALKVPHASHLNKEMLASFRKEARLAATLDHPNVLGIKNASFIDGQFVIVYPLGQETLGERLRRRMATATAIDLADQMLEAVAWAHRHRIIHCDIKPENFILFDGGRLRLTDFGIAKIAVQTRALSASGAGTLGYVAPEQALGKPSFRSDVFSLGLVLYRVFSGTLPEWPFEPPLPGYRRLRERCHPTLIQFLGRALEVDERKRFRDAIQMQVAFDRIKGQTLRQATRRRKKRNGEQTASKWRTIREREFRRRFGKTLETALACSRCHGPISQAMSACPWCGTERKRYRGPTTFPARCPRCARGVKNDWSYCAWCYGASIGPASTRTYSDRRYATTCGNTRCRGSLMPFMRYCPWCRSKVRRVWKIPGSADRCDRCGWGIIREFWSHCPWCGKRHAKS